jgi:hypothetical protein
MCYEFSGWFTNARAVEKSRKEQPNAEQVIKQSPPEPESRPAAPEPRVKERETAPA